RPQNGRRNGVGSSVRVERPTTVHRLSILATCNIQKTAHRIAEVSVRFQPRREALDTLAVTDDQHSASGFPAQRTPQHIAALRIAPSRERHDVDGAGARNCCPRNLSVVRSKNEKDKQRSSQTN